MKELTVSIVIRIILSSHKIQRGIIILILNYTVLENIDILKCVVICMFLVYVPYKLSLLSCASLLLPLPFTRLARFLFVVLARFLFPHLGFSSSSGSCSSL